jgi:hypothetical protein
MDFFPHYEVINDPRLKNTIISHGYYANFFTEKVKGQPPEINI